MLDGCTGWGGSGGLERRVVVRGRGAYPDARKIYFTWLQSTADLFDFLQGLPPTWREDLFTSSPHSPAATCRTVLELPGPETAPYDRLDWESCPACAEAQDQCRYHHGVFAGMEYQRALITTALTDHTAIDQLQQRHSELAATTVRTAAADTSTSTTP
ncbi:hypothetical protein ACFRFU_53960 [Streptomyces sp. NPDC056704]|uniref:hypothetical protein n=1 Tax=Streptomyces sp. NPDC056704 TaxID=3345917 RepID=UPI003674F3F7